ncbi:unnamed protein product [Podospora anserina S mat+]|uniref:Podospora anserina S mat+ genomic DNA chromosome 3, supercontig 1 n=1 Tax=Podospora anserina (strain S / ATCC MYA-4624 / DSM 980 / FGSC 10383) TaxID=515849 RepID=B2ACA5_PODAN|nr:unnamed protein product [Podospora anserina S mat+]CDP26522.1 Putative protein of unknown function [Podospora anserina S mat+]
MLFGWMGGVHVLFLAESNLCSCRL